MNSPHQMESFDTNIDYFGGINQCQQYFLSLPLKSSDLFLLSQPGTKITKINFCTKIEFEKK